MSILNKAEVLSMNKTKSPSIKTKKNEGLKLKKNTFEAWVRLLYKEGMIDTQRQNVMLKRISSLTS